MLCPNSGTMMVVQSGSRKYQDNLECRIFAFHQRLCSGENASVRSNGAVTSLSVAVETEGLAEQPSAKAKGGRVEKKWKCLLQG